MKLVAIEQSLIFLVFLCSIPGDSSGLRQRFFFEVSFSKHLRVQRKESCSYSQTSFSILLNWGHIKTTCHLSLQRAAETSIWESPMGGTVMPPVHTGWWSGRQGQPLRQDGGMGAGANLGFRVGQLEGQYHLASLLYLLGYFLQMIYLFSSDVSLIQWSLDFLTGSFYAPGKIRAKPCPKPKPGSFLFCQVISFLG